MEAKAKKVVRRNLPLNETYKIVGSYYTGGVLENPMCCHNCGKLIANVAEVENSKGQRFDVGLDCAETLSGLKDQLWGVNAEFAEAKGIRAKVNKVRKNGKAIETEITEIGEVVIRGPFTFAWMPQAFFKRFFPDLLPTLLNPKGLGFEAIEVAVEGAITKERFETPEYFEADGIKAKVYYGKTEKHGHGIFCIEVDGNEYQDYNRGSVSGVINRMINKKRLEIFISKK